MNKKAKKVIYAATKDKANRAWLYKQAKKEYKGMSHTEKAEYKRRLKLSNQG